MADGHFDSVEDAVTAAVLGIGPDHDGDPGDLSWAKPYIDAGLSSLARGETVPHDQVWADLKVRFGTSS